MGGLSSTSLGSSVGHWFNGKPIYSRDLAMVNAKISNGQYVLVESVMNMPEDHEMFLTLYDDSGSVLGGKKYAKRLSGFKHWYITHSASIVRNIAAQTSIPEANVTRIIYLALPVLIDMGKETAKHIVEAELGAGSSKTINVVIDRLAESLRVKLPETNMMNVSLGRSAYVGSSEFYQHVDPSAYLGAVQKFGALDMPGAEYAGGCDCEDGRFIGSDELDISTVKDYANSVNSQAKSKIIDEILAIGAQLGFKITGDDQPSRIKSMLALLPTTFKSGDTVQAGVCNKIASAINRIHGNEIIKLSMPPEVICQQVAEIVSSLSAGMHTEFLAVYNDVRRVLKNLHILKNALKDDHDAIMLRVKDSGDALLPPQTTTLSDLHKILTDEIDRQIQMLSNLLNVSLVPAEKDLAALLSSKKDIHGYIDKIDVKIGSDRFGKVISDILKGLGLTANFAIVIEKALKTVGITMQEYAKSESLQKLREKITNGVLGREFDETQLHEYLEAAELLYRNFYRNQDIAAITKTGQGEMFQYPGGEYEGGVDKYQATVMDKRVADRSRLRNLIFNTFFKQINASFDSFIGNLDILTMKVGTEIPLSEQLNSFRHVLQRVNENLIRSKNIYFALIGYYNDAMSKSKKDELLGELRMVSSFIDSIVEMPLYASSKHYFTAVQQQIAAIIALIDRFSDEIASKFGRGEDADPECAFLDKNDKHHGEKQGEFENIDAVFGGEDTLTTFEDKPRLIYKSTRTISVR